MNPDRSGPMSTEGVAIALSKDEQRTLDEIERALREDDPRLVSAVNFGRFRRRRIIVGETAFIRGMIALVVGEVVSQVHIAGGVLVSVAGFIAMFVALARAILPGIRNRDYSFPLVADSSIPRPEMRPMFLSVQANGRCDPQPPAGHRHDQGVSQSPGMRTASVTCPHCCGAWPRPVVVTRWRSGVRPVSSGRWALGRSPSTWRRRTPGTWSHSAGTPGSPRR